MVIFILSKWTEYCSESYSHENYGDNAFLDSEQPTVMTYRRSFVRLQSNICVGRFRILGGQGLEYWEAQGGANSQQAHDVDATQRRHIDVISTSCAHKVFFIKTVPNNYISHLKI